MICVTENEMDIILKILKKHVPKAEVFVFGSRYKGTNKEHSDIDIAVDFKRKMSLKEHTVICEAFEESELPFRVDVLDYNNVSPEFRLLIDAGYEKLIL